MKKKREKYRPRIQSSTDCILQVCKMAVLQTKICWHYRYDIEFLSPVIDVFLEQQSLMCNDKATVAKGIINNVPC